MLTVAKVAGFKRHAARLADAARKLTYWLNASRRKSRCDKRNVAPLPTPAPSCNNGGTLR